MIRKRIITGILSVLLCCLSLSLMPAAAAQGVYVKDCGIAIPPVIATEYGEGLFQNEESPATVFLYLNQSLCLANGTTLPAALADIGKRAVPVLYVRDRESADRLSDYIQNTQLADCIVASDDAALVAAMRSACPTVQGLLDFRGKEISSVADVRNSANCSGAKIVLLDFNDASAANVRRLQTLLMTVWCQAESDVEIYSAVVRGCNGILTADAQLAYDLLTSFDEGTLARIPMIIGHRGIYTEKQNTLSGVQAAYQAGADAVECDIYLTADNRLVIMHDSSLTSTTTGTGSVETMTLEEIQEFEVDYGGGAINRPIPALDDFFEEFKGKDLVHFVEIKSTRPEIVPALKSLIEKYDVSDQVVVISFLQDQLARVHEQIPELSVGYLVNSLQGYDPEGALRKLSPMNATLNPAYGFATAAFMNALAPRGITVWPWTYPNNADADSAYMDGVYGITTDSANRSSEHVVKLQAADIALKNSDSQSAALTATAVTQSGASYEVTCGYLKINGNLSLSMAGGGKYYAESGSSVVLLKYNFEYGSVNYTIYSDPITVSVENDAPKGISKITLGIVLGAAGLACIAGIVVFVCVKKLRRKTHGKQ